MLLLTFRGFLRSISVAEFNWNTETFYTEWKMYWCGAALDQVCWKECKQKDKIVLLCWEEAQSGEQPVADY